MRVVTVRLIAVRLGPAAARAAAAHLYVLVQGRVRPLPVLVRGARRGWMLMADVAALGDETQLGLQLHPVLPSTVLAVATGHAAKLSDGAAGGVLLFLCP